MDTFGHLPAAVDDQMQLVPPRAERDVKELDRHAVTIALIFRGNYERRLLDQADFKAADAWSDSSQ